MNPTHVVATFIESMLPRFSHHTLGLNITLSVVCSSFREEVSFIVVRPSNYTQVYYRVESISSKGKSMSDWKLSSDHDSCWQSDGLSPINKVLCELHSKCDDNNEEFDPYISFSIVSSPRYVLLKENIIDGYTSTRYYNDDTRDVENLEIENSFISIAEAHKYFPKE